jgi:hypothetical protein
MRLSNDGLSAVVGHRRDLRGIHVLALHVLALHVLALHVLAMDDA